MTKLKQTKFHKVFPVEREGETLIIAPQGDAAGFRESDVQSELKTLSSLVADPDYSHLLIDFSHSNYFGSIIIGAMHSLGVQVRSAGGLIGICHVSDEMREALRTLKLNSNWTEFDSVKSALKEFNK